jgi:hypothetical protein|tara:strand:+ start:1159 stop:1770 length:612 start_codon:yes stop_codon:yes gene_type:complete
MKFAYFNPTVMAVDDVTAEQYSRLREIVNAAHEHNEHNDEGDPNISIRGGQQVQVVPNEFKLDTSFLSQYIEERCQAYIDNIIKTSGVSDLNGYKPMLVSAWTIKQTAGDYQALHNHEAHISGNIYLDVPLLDEGSKSSDANIEFRLPVIRNPAHFVFTDQWRFKPEPLKMIIFPSYVSHTVYPWKGQGSRTILAWDVKLIAK